MFIGHYSAAFLGKRFVPEMPLPICFVAAQCIDIIWSCLVLAGVEKLRLVPNFTASNNLDLYFMPYTHSLSSALIWSAVVAVLFWLCMPKMKQPRRAAVVIGLLVASHWALDLLVHVHDLPLWFDSAKVGLGWWNYRTFALLLELILLWAGVWLCLKTVAARWRYGLLASVMSVVQIISLYKQPTNGEMVAWQLLVVYLILTALAYWADKPRRQATHQSISVTGERTPAV
jgi:hypothetical protein